MTPLADIARAMFAAAVNAVQPDGLLRRLQFLDDGVEFSGNRICPSGRLVFVSLGKAAPGFTASFLAHAHRRPDVTFVLTPYGVEAPAEIEPFLHRGSHPLPDAAGEAATGSLLDLLAGLDEHDGVVLLLSGGASALLAQPLAGLSRERVTELTRALLAAGANIHEINAVRKHVLAAAGGRMAAICPAPILTLALSDVPGDDLTTIASGPTVGDPTTWADAAGVLERHGLAVDFGEFDTAFRAGTAGAAPDSPKPGTPELARSQVHLLGTSREALVEAAHVARRASLTPVIVTRRLRGEAREIGDALANLARSTATGEPLALLFAGETTVTVRGRGRGGRNLELALAAALALVDLPDRCLLAGGTDGVDGAAPAAGAVVDGQTIHRAAEFGRDALTALDNNDSWRFFDGLEETIITGPTGTNVADLVFVLVAGQPREFVPRDVSAIDILSPYAV